MGSKHGSVLPTHQESCAETIRHKPFGLFRRGMFTRRRDGRNLGGIDRDGSTTAGVMRNNPTCETTEFVEQPWRGNRTYYIAGVTPYDQRTKTIKGRVRGKTIERRWGVTPCRKPPVITSAPGPAAPELGFLISLLQSAATESSHGARDFVGGSGIVIC